MRFAIGLSAALIILSAGVTRADESLPGPLITRLEARFEQLKSSACIPYQAVRVRFTLRNPGINVVRGLSALEEGNSRRVWIKGPSDTDFWQVYDPYQVVGSERIVADDISHPFERSPLIELSAGEETSVSFTLAFHRPPAQIEKEEWKPLFSRPGRYEVELRYPTRNRPGESLTRPLTIDVVQPEGDDLRVYGILTKNPGLARELLSSVDDPLDEFYEPLQEIVKKYPQSSYADYARFALARRGLMGSGYYFLRSNDYGRKRVQDVCDKCLTLTSANEKTHLTLYDCLANSMLFPRGVSGVREAVVRRAVASRDNPAAWKAARKKFIEMAYVSPDRRREAIRLINAISAETEFAYWPNALCTQYFAASTIDEVRAENLRKTMEATYPD